MLPGGIAASAKSLISDAQRRTPGYAAAVTGALAGRDGERSALGSWLDEMVAGMPRVVLISGEPGGGKTRLLDQLIDDARARGVAAVVGRAVEQEGAPPFWPWRLVFRELGAPDLLGAPGAAGDAPSQRFARFEDTARWLQQHAEAHGGLVIGLDDLHCTDVPTMRLVAHVATGLSAAPLLLAITHRPAATAGSELAALLDDLLRLPIRRSLTLRALDRAAVAEMLGPAARHTTVERVLELTGGNPLFVRELAHQLDAGASIEEIPDSLRALVGERLTGLTSDGAEVLRAAAVTGREFAAAVVATAVGRPILETLRLLEDALGVGLLQPGPEPGRFRFTHLLVRDVIAAAVPADELPVLHRRLAEAVESYEGTGDDHVHDLARHWDHAAILGDAHIAAEWSERAADAADRALAWEEAVRLYDRALALSPPGTAPEIRHRRLLGAARGLLHSELVPHAVGRCVEAAKAAEEAGRPDLAADAALLIEGRGGSAGPEITIVIDIAERALAGVEPADHTRRARLLGLLAALYFYVDPSRCEQLSVVATEESARAGSPEAVVAATRARQMVQFGSEHAPERLDLARQIGDAGRALRDASITQWEPLWRIDALLELGRVHEAIGELPELRRLTESIQHPVSKWHRMRAEAVLAAATGRWEEARGFGAIARDIHSRYESHEAAVTLELALQTTLGMHVGFPTDVLDDYDRLDLTRAPGYVSDIPVLLPALAKLALGRREEVERDYSRLAPVDEWTPPPFLWLPIHTMRLLAAIELGRLSDIPPLLERFEPHRGRHVSGGGGPIAYFGCVELHLGHGTLALGDLDAAVDHLRIAVRAGATATTPPFEVRAAALLAETHLQRGTSEDGREAIALAHTYGPRAAALGMGTWQDRLEQASAPCGRDDPGPLSARELEVAGLVAGGLTNKEIAAELFVSVRTAQNHVQHILTKLGLSNRTQIAAWHRDRQR